MRLSHVDRKGIQQREEDVTVPEARGYVAFFQKSEGIAEITKGS